MIRITQLKLPVERSPEALKKKAAKLLRIVPEEIEKVVICRQSLDARKKPELFYSYTVDVQVAPGKREENLVHKAKSNQVSISKEKPYEFPQSGDESLGGRPVIIGAGPAGLFCGLMLARAGYKPVILERGDRSSRSILQRTVWRGWSRDIFGRKTQHAREGFLRAQSSRAQDFL